jgi:signal transduction histidine kinase
MLLPEVISLAEVDDRINDVGVHFAAEQDIPPVIVDAVQIQQVALNLIRNAMESMIDQESRQQGVLVSTRYDGRAVLVKVMDGGTGVAEQNREELFTPFFTTKAGGMGVGLSICQSIIHAHGGNIGHSNNVGTAGSTFYFTLPSTRLQ